MKVPAFPVYVFDVDGTLLDSARDICGAIQDVLLTKARTDVQDTFLRRYIGRHLIDLFQDLFPDLSADEIGALVLHYREVYPARNHRLTSPYEGISAMLAALPGRKSTATTKGTPTTRTVLEISGLLPYFDHVQGTDGFPHKPSPDVILRSLEALGARPEDCLFVGDSPQDMEAGRRAGVKTCAVRWGYGDPAEMAVWEPDYWIDSPAELAGR